VTRAFSGSYMLSLQLVAWGLPRRRSAVGGASYSTAPAMQAAIAGVPERTAGAPTTARPRKEKGRRAEAPSPLVTVDERQFANGS